MVFPVPDLSFQGPAQQDPDETIQPPEEILNSLEKEESQVDEKDQKEYDKWYAENKLQWRKPLQPTGTGPLGLKSFSTTHHDMND